MSNLGDIVVTAGIDSRKWYEEAAALGNSAKALGGKIHEGLSGGKGSLIVDTLSSTLSGGLGGATGTVSKAIDGYLSRFGALGAATGLLVGVGISAAVASLEKENRAFQQVGETIGTTTTRLDGFIERQRSLASFQAGLGRIGTTAAGTASLVEIDSRISAGKSINTSLASEERGLLRDLSVATEALETSKINADENFFTSLLGFEDATVPFAKAVSEIEGKLEAVRNRRAANAAGVGSAQEQRDLLLQEQSNIEKRERSAEAQKIREADPGFSAKTRLEKIRGLVADGFLEKGVGAAAGKLIFAEFQRAIAPPDTTGLRNEGNVAGTSSAFSALQASLRQDRAATEGLSSTSQQMLETLKQILAALTDSAEEPPGEDV
jgi:hypothetical protein